MDYGHYYSYVKMCDNKNYNKDGELYCFNDEKYEKSNFPKVSYKALNVFYKLKSFWNNIFIFIIIDQKNKI